MRSYRKLTVLIGAALVVAALPSLAGAGAAGPTSGTWTFTDVTANPTVFLPCGPEVPSAPIDVNTYEIKVTKKLATLTTTSHNVLDWAAEIRDKSGAIVDTRDGFLPTDQENFSTVLSKGTYTVSYCNFAGEPEITVDWSLK